MTFSEFASGLQPYCSGGLDKEQYFNELIGNFIQDAAMDSCPILQKKRDTKYRYITGKRQITPKDALYLYEHRDKRKFSKWIADQTEEFNSYEGVISWLKSQGENNTCADDACADLFESIVLSLASPSRATNHSDEENMPNRVNPSKKYYNLIVSNLIDLDATSSSFIMSPDRAIKEYTADEIKEQFSDFPDDAIRELLTFPTIFAHENETYGAAGQNQKAGLGYITAIKVRKEGIIIKLLIKKLFPQQLLNDNLLNFDIAGITGLAELNRTHWAIKKVNLLDELRELGY